MNAELAKVDKKSAKIRSAWDDRDKRPINRKLKSFNISCHSSNSLKKSSKIQLLTQHPLLSDAKKKEEANILNFFGNLETEAHTEATNQILSYEKLMPSLPLASELIFIHHNREMERNHKIYIKKKKRKEKPWMMWKKCNQLNMVFLP